MLWLQSRMGERHPDFVPLSKLRDVAQANQPGRRRCQKRASSREKSLSGLEPAFSMFLSSCCSQQRRSIFIFLIFNHVCLCSQQMGRPFRRPSWSALRCKFSMRPRFDGRNRDPGVRHCFVALYSFNLPALQSRVSKVFASAAPTSARTSAKVAHHRTNECITKP